MNWVNMSSLRDALIRLHDYLMTLSIKNGLFPEHLFSCCPRTHRGGAVVIIFHPIHHGGINDTICATSTHAAVTLFWIKASIRRRDELLCILKSCR